MNFQHALILLAVLSGSIWLAKGAYEFFQSPGTIIQLLAKGPQDWYLTDWPKGHAGAYYYPWRGYYYGHPYYHSYRYWY